MCASEYVAGFDSETAILDKPTVAMVRDKNHYYWDTQHGFGGQTSSKLATLGEALDMLWAAFCSTGEAKITFPKIGRE